MSSILDALNRSEKERNEKGSDESDTVHTSSPSHGKHGRWVVAVVAVLVVSVAAAGWVWRDAVVTQVKRFAGDTPGTVSDQQAVAADENGSSSVVERPAKKRNNSAKGAGQGAAGKPDGAKQRRGKAAQPKPESTSKGGKMTAAERKAARIAERKAQRRQSKEQNNPTNGKSSSAAVVANSEPSSNGLVPVVDDSPNDLASVKAAEPRSKTVEIGKPRRLQQDPSRPGNTTAVASAASDEKASGYVLVHELPLGVRVNLPEIQLNMHVYHQNPGSRFVMLNMQRFQVGDTMEELKVKVKGIEPEGVVLQYNGHEFLLPNGS
ncbi:MAG: hypothetical protein DHS20C11_30360 [Lysobacteraceae bacterium]|nr:MAG: hypothetical protein DHS20C11_30360 [Xanthomonadaceae bacterium]